MPYMSLQSLNLFGHGVEVFSIILLPRGLHSPKSGTVEDIILCDGYSSWLPRLGVCRNLSEAG